MRPFLVVSLSLGLFAFACGNKSSGTAGSGSGSGSDTGSGSADKLPPVSGEAPIALPKSDGTPAHKTDRKLERPDWKRMAAFDFPPFKKRIRNTKTGLDVRFTTDRPKIGTTVTITNCFSCPAMVLDEWKKRTADLQFILGDELRSRPDTTWEIGSKDLHGTMIVWTYQVGHYFGKDENGNPHAAYSDAFAAYFNDGTNQIRVVAEYQDAPVSREEMLAIAPREDLEHIATAFIDFYVHEWDKPSPPIAEGSGSDADEGSGAVIAGPGSGSGSGK